MAFGPTQMLFSLTKGPRRMVVWVSGMVMEERTTSR
jgi:hypothetical protein